MGMLAYFPFTTPPREVIFQGVLYWDGIASFAPPLAASSLPEALDLLRERNLYRSLNYSLRSLSNEVDHLGWRAPSPAFPNDGLALLDVELRRIASRPGTPPSQPGRARLDTRKLGPFAAHLVSLGLGRQLSSVSLETSREVMDVVIGTLVREIAARESRYLEAGRSLHPYTDRPEAWERALRTIPGNDLFSQPSDGWELEIGRLLPVPHPGTDLETVLEFRDRYADERIRLMREVHRLLGGLRTDYEHPADIIANLRHDLDQGVADYRAAMRGSRMAWVHRSINVAIAIAATGAGELLLPQAGWELGLLSGITINLATRDIRPSYNWRKDGATGQPFAYLHRTTTELSP